MPSKILFTDNQINELKQLIESGTRQLDIAKHFNVTDDTIRRICRENDIQIRQPHKCVCVICGDIFYSNIKGTRTCSKEHHRICEVCGKDFIVDRYNIKTTCKGECSNLIKYGVKCPASAKEVVEKRAKTLRERYKTDPEAKQLLRNKQIKACLERYGAESWSGSKIGREQIRATNLVKYGYEEPFADSEVRLRQREINKQRYGDEHPMRTEAIKSKFKQSCIDKYGVENPMQHPKIKQRLMDNYKAKTGYDCTMHNPEVKDKINKTCLEKFGVPWPCMRAEARNYKTRSKLNRAFEVLLSSYNIEFTSEFPLGSYSYDFKCGSTLLELDPSITHNSYMSIFKEGKPLDCNYHVNKTQTAINNSYRCIHIFDWDNWETIVSLLQNKISIYARKCIIAKLNKEQINIFVNDNHLQGSCRGQDVAYGLFYNDELVQVMTFGKPRYNKKFDFELLRLCSKVGYEIVGGASRLFSQFKKDYPNSSIISYCDAAKFSGNVYTAIGMKLDYITEPAKVWSKGDKYVTDNLLRQRGFDQLFGTTYGKGTSNESLMIENGWLPVYDCGQKVFTYFPSN